MVVRGAPAIGVAAAYGIALAAASGDDLDEADRVLRASRPTAVNLAWALDEMRDDPPPTTPGASTPTRSSAAGAWRRTPPSCSRPARARSRTATRAASPPAATAARSARCSRPGSAGCSTHVWVDETRPLLQGARLTAWELEAAGIPHAVIADSAAALADGGRRGRLRVHRRRPDRRKRRHRQQDRHVLARRPRAPPRIPLYVVAPSSTVDHRDAATARRSRSRSATRRRSRRASPRATRPSTSRPQR